MDAASSSLQAELQRKKLELAQLQRQVLKAEQSGRRSQRAERTASWSQTRASRRTQKKSPQTSVHATDGSSGSRTQCSADLRQETTTTELALGISDSVCGREEEEPFSKFNSPKENPSLPHIQVKDTSGLSKSLVPTTSPTQDEHSFTTAEQNRNGYNQEMKVLRLVGSSVKDSEDPYSPIGREGMDYPVQYLVRQTRSMSTKMNAQTSDGESALLQHQRGTGDGVHGGRKRRKRKGETSLPAPLLSVESTSSQTDGRAPPQQGCDGPRHSCNDLEELRVSIPICRKSPITVVNAALQQRSTSAHRRFGTNPPLMKQLLFPQLSQKVSQLTTNRADFFLPDEGFQALKLQKLQSVQHAQVLYAHQLGGKRKLRRRSKFTSYGYVQGQDTGSSQSDLEFCTQEVDISKGLQTCVPPSVVCICTDRTEQGEHVAPSGGAVPSNLTVVSPNPCGVSSNHFGHSLHCTIMKMAGSEVVSTTELKQVTCLPSVSKPTAGVQPLGGSLQAAAMDTSSGVHFVAVVFPGRIAVYKFENGGSSTTPGASWESNSCCLGEDEVVQQSALLSNSGDILLVVGGLLKECVARLFVSGGSDHRWYDVNLKRSPPAANTSLHCSALCCWVDGVGRRSVVVGSQATHGTTAVDAWTLQKDENEVKEGSIEEGCLTLREREDLFSTHRWHPLQWSSCPLPPSVTMITSLSHVKHTDSCVLGVADLMALLWDASKGVLLKKVALGCSGPQPRPLGVRPVGVAAFHEQGTIFLLLGCTLISSCPVPSDSRSPPLVGTPPCTCWLLAFEASVTTDCNSGVPSTCRLLQTYRPPEEDHDPRLLQHCCCCSATQEVFIMAVSGNSVLEWNLLSPQLCRNIHISADQDGFSLVSACWLSDRSAFLALDSEGSLHVFSEELLT